MITRVKEELKNAIHSLIDSQDYYNGEQVRLNKRYGLYIKLEEMVITEDLLDDIFIELNEIYSDDGDEWWEPVDTAVYIISDYKSIDELINNAFKDIGFWVNKYNIVLENRRSNNKVMVRKKFESTDYDKYAKLLADYLGIGYDDVYEAGRYYYEIYSDRYPDGRAYYVGTEDEMYETAVDEFESSFIDHGEDYVEDESLQWALQKTWDDSNGDIEDFDRYEIAYMIDSREFAKNVIDEWGIANELACYDGKELIIGNINNEKIYAYRV